MKEVRTFLAAGLFLALLAGPACAWAQSTPRRVGSTPSGGLQEPGTPGHPRARVTMEAARRVALSAVSGRVVAEELERERGRWIYSFEIRPAGERGRRIREVNVDAHSGAVIGPIETERH